MYTYEQRMRAVSMYLSGKYSCNDIIKELGYPSCRQSILNWCEDYQRDGNLPQNFEKETKYPVEEKIAAINFFYEHGGSITRTVRELGYPSRQMLRSWLKYGVPDPDQPCQLYQPNVYLSQSQKEIPVQMAKKRDPKTREEAEAMIAELKAEVAQLTEEATTLKKQVYRLDLEKSILEKAAEVLKKDRGISIKTLTNREKAVVINALRERFPLKDLLESIQIAKSSYCYQVVAMKTDRYCAMREIVRNVFEESKGRYGYRRVHAVIKAGGKQISEKVIRRLMHEEDLSVRKIKKRKFNSYLGEISPAVENIIDRNFHAEKPNEKWLTDITEFHIPAGKVYLSPIIDCFDGLPVSWTIGTSPNAELANTMLDEAIITLKDDEKPIVHSDRGGHYRWPGWIERMEAAGLTRSMSKKGCSPDNSACEGFFGRLKNEMFYGVSWKGVSIDSFIHELDQYINWYANDRIKLSLGGMSPMDYRRSLGLLEP